MERPRSIFAPNGDTEKYASLEIKLRNPQLYRETFLKDYSNILRTEIPKESNETQWVNTANTLLERRARKYTDQTFPMTEQNVHKIPHEEITKLAGPATAGLYILKAHEIFYSASLKTPQFVHAVNHEMAHSKSFNLFSVVGENEGGVSIAGYRSGISVASPDGQYCHLENLNEAITESLAVETTNKFYEDTGLDKQIDELVLAYNDVMPEFGMPLENRAEVFTFLKNEGDTIPGHFFYTENRNFFQILVEGIYSKNKEAFSNLEGVKDIFYQAYFTGDTSKLSQEIDAAYGVGTFQMIYRLDRTTVARQNDSDKVGLKLQAYISGLTNEHA